MSDFFHLRTIPGNAWPPVASGGVSQMWSMYLGLDRTQWWEPAAIEEGQLRQVRTLLAHCIEHVPHYRQVLREAGVVPDAIRTMADFRRLPTLERRTYQQSTANFLARQLPEGTARTNRLHTSGTSGMPIEVVQTNLVNLWWFALYLRDFEWCGIDPRGSMAAIRALPGDGATRTAVMNGVRLPNWGDQLHAIVENGPAFAMDIHQDPRRQLEWLKQVTPDHLLSYPPNLEFLAGLLLQEGTRLPGLRVIQAIGETLTDEARARIEAGFGVPVKSTYSCVEAGYLASPCPAGHGMHVHSENVLVEVLDDAGQPCPPGQRGRVVITTLHNFLNPFIRYELLDEATPGPERCPCGRGLPLLSAVFGKRRPQFRLPDGRRKDSGFLVRQLRKMGDYFQHQLVQRGADHIIVRLAVSKPWDEARQAAVRACVQEYFEAKVRVDIEMLDHLPKTAAGKHQEVLVEVE
jgi:phenylacetate-CoA ligase